MPGPGIPEIKWGTFFDKNKVAHVGPTIETFLMLGHKLTVECFCSPYINQGPYHHIVIHNVVH